MKLHEGNIGESYRIESVIVDARINRRLEALGVNEGTDIHVLNKKGSGTMIIRVRGTRLAIGRKIADGISVKEVSGS